MKPWALLLIVGLLGLAFALPPLPHGKKVRRPYTPPTQGAGAMLLLKLKALPAAFTNRVALSWNGIGATNYQVLRSTNLLSWSVLTNVPGGATNVVLALVNQPMGFFRVQPQMTLLESDYSNEVQTKLAAAGSVSLAWDASTNSLVDHYTIYQGRAPHVYTNLVNMGKITSGTVTGLKAGTNTFAATVMGVGGTFRIQIKKLK